MTRYYRRVAINENGDSVEPVQFVGIHPLRWEDAPYIAPTAAFVEAPEVDQWISALQQIASNGALGLQQHQPAKTLQECIISARMALTKATGG